MESNIQIGTQATNTESSPTEEDKVWTYLNACTVVVLRNMLRSLRMPRPKLKSAMMRSILKAGKINRKGTWYESFLEGYQDWKRINSVVVRWKTAPADIPNDFEHEHTLHLSA